ncbi:low quality protein: putative nuclease harbi1 [Plakobranchus ocellatus]|uniref:Low quality protein: putative nuclease harbi1 n=1 Tax=Plakobranchus ocellatus TaxID=259542 RepID=A0AAV4DS85_9GAST|nr:low quality protein: putative nuclease harbi1 [Plakobranchus ocellatus]
MDAVFVYYQRRRLRRPRIMRDRSNPLDFMNDVDLHCKFRFVRADILSIIALIHDVINYENQRGLALSSSLQVLIALRFYATGGFQDVIGELVGVTQVTVSRTLRRVTNALYQQVGSFIRMPTQVMANIQKTKFFAVAGIPNIFACVDGTQ